MSKKRGGQHRKRHTKPTTPEWQQATSDRLERPFMKCGVCNDPLHELAFGAGYAHPRLEVRDHEPVPVRGIVDKTRHICDFCSEPATVTYTIENDFAVGFRDPDTGVVVPNKNFGQLWFACVRCEPMVSAGKLHELLDRSEAFLFPRMGFLSPESKQFGHRLYKTIFEQFFKAKPRGPVPL